MRPHALCVGLQIGAKAETDTQAAASFMASAKKISKVKSECLKPFTIEIYCRDNFEECVPFIAIAKKTQKSVL